MTVSSGPVTVRTMASIPIMTSAKPIVDSGSKDQPQCCPAYADAARAYGIPKS